MLPNAYTSGLYLLVPWKLPTEQQLSEAEKAKVCKALNQLLQALKQTSHQKSLATVNQGLANLDLDNVSAAQASSTKTPLKFWEVEDFDKYFGVIHVQTSEPAVCLVASVLVAYQTFLALNNYSNRFNPNQVELQKRGFESYARLLARVFNLCLEET